MSIKVKMGNMINKYVWRLAEINSKNISTMMLHQKTFLPLKNCCVGKKIVLCGAGPSLQNYEPIEDAIHIALNRAFLFDKVKFDYIFVQDFDGIKFCQQELIDYEGNNCIKLLGTQDGGVKEIPQSLAAKCNAVRFNTDIYIYHDGYKSKFVSDLESRPLGNMPNVGISAMQFVLYMNPAEVYLVGCDNSGTHFTNQNQSQKEIELEKKQYDNYWETEYKKLICKWKELKKFAEIHYPDTKIISINPVGLKGIFQDIYQNRE